MPPDEIQLNSSTRRSSYGNNDRTRVKRKSNAYMAAEAVQQERDAVRALKRLSMGGSLTIDPDLPFGVDNELENFQKKQSRRSSNSSSSISSSSISSSHDEELDINDTTLINEDDYNDDDNNNNNNNNNNNTQQQDAKINAEKLLWVPAKSHPSIAPDKFRRHVESTLGDMHKRIHSKDKSSDSIPSLKELTDELDKLSEMAGLAATDAITLARSLSSASSSLLLQQNPKPRRAISAGATDNIRSQQIPQRPLSSPSMINDLNHWKHHGKEEEEEEEQEEQEEEEEPRKDEQQDVAEDDEDQILQLDDEDQDVPLFTDSTNSLKRNKWNTYSRSRPANNIKPKRNHSPLIDENKFTDDNPTNDDIPPEPPLKSRDHLPQRRPSYPSRDENIQKQLPVSNSPQRRPSQGNSQSQLIEQNHRQFHPKQHLQQHLQQHQQQQSKYHQHQLQNKSLPYQHSQHPQQSQQHSRTHPQHLQHQSQQRHNPSQHQASPQDKPLPNQYSHAYQGHHTSQHSPQLRQRQAPISQYQDPSPSAPKKTYGRLKSQKQELPGIPSIPRSSSEHHERPKNEYPMARSQSDIRVKQQQQHPEHQPQQQRPDAVVKRTNHSRNRHAGSLITLDSQSQPSGSPVSNEDTLPKSPLERRPLAQKQTQSQFQPQLQAQLQAQPQDQQQFHPQPQHRLPLSTVESQPQLSFELGNIQANDQRNLASDSSLQPKNVQLSTPPPPPPPPSSSSFSSSSSSSSAAAAAAAPPGNASTSNDPFIESASETSPKKESKSKDFLNIFKMKRSTSPKIGKEVSKKKEEPLNDQENQIIPGQLQKSPQRPSLKGSTFKFGKKEDKKSSSTKKSPIKSSFTYKTGDPKSQEVAYKSTTTTSGSDSPTTPTSQISVASNRSPSPSPSGMVRSEEDQHRLQKENLNKKLSLENMKKSNKPNAPVQFTDSAFGFPLPPLSHSTIIMLDYRFPVHVERALYRLSHLKLANPRRPLRQQVLLSNFMYAYLNLVNHTLYLQQLTEESVTDELPLDDEQ